MCKRLPKPTIKTQKAHALNRHDLFHHPDIKADGKLKRYKIVGRTALIVLFNAYTNN
jgi:hypothetical protein